MELREKDGLLILYKGGEKHASIQLEQIKDKAKQYTPDERKKKTDNSFFYLNISKDFPIQNFKL